jgi:hypothetical protein
VSRTGKGLENAGEVAEVLADPDTARLEVEHAVVKALALPHA